MSVKIRMKRMGSKKRPFYRIVVADSRAPRDGRFIEEIGYYNPLDEGKTFVVKEDRIQYWYGTGARPSDTVERLLKENGVFEKLGTAQNEKPSAKINSEEVIEENKKNTEEGTTVDIEKDVEKVSKEAEELDADPTPTEVIESKDGDTDAEEVVEENEKNTEEGTTVDVEKDVEKVSKEAEDLDADPTPTEVIEEN